MEVRRSESDITQGGGLKSPFVLLLLGDLIPAKARLRLRHPHSEVVKLLIREVRSAVAAVAPCLLLEECQPALGSVGQGCFVAGLEAIVGGIARQVSPFV